MIPIRVHPKELAKLINDICQSQFLAMKTLKTAQIITFLPCWGGEAIIVPTYKSSFHGKLQAIKTYPHQCIDIRTLSQNVYFHCSIFLVCQN